MTQKDFKHIGIIRKLAWSFHCTTGIDFDDLVSEGILAYHESFERFDEKTHGTARSTFTWIHVKNHLITYCKKETKFNLGRHCLDDVNVEQSPALFSTKANPKDIFESFTKDAEQIAKVVLQRSKRIVVLPENEVEPYIVSILSHKGWTPDRTLHGLQELKRALA
jgi:DNA-directed RNA polymerase specialized sigma subunit